MPFDQNKFNQFVLDQGIVGFFPQPIKLVSGRMSSWYVNWRNVSSDVFSMDQLVQFVLAFVKEKKIPVHCFYGTPDGATKLAVLCQFQWAKKQSDYGPAKYPLAMGRKTPKDHGDPKDRLFVGAPSGQVVVLEDVTTTGGSLLKTVQKLREQDIEVTAAIALTNRNEVMDDGRHVRDALADMGVAYHCMSQGIQLLPLAFQQLQPGKKIAQSIKAEFDEFGEQPVSLS